MREGGCCRSLSIMTTASESQWSRPARSDIWWPKRAERASTRTEGSAAAMPLSTSSVRSVPRSTTKRTVALQRSATVSSTRRSSAWKAGMTSSSS